MRDRMAPGGGRWLLAALLLAGCAGPVIGAAYDTKDPVDRWQAALRANAARYVCGAPLAEGGEARLSDALVEAQHQAESDAAGQLAGASGAPGSQQAVWQELGARRAANERDAASLARQRGCRSGPVEELIGSYRNFAAMG
jgi:hypothetical protein